MTNTNTDLDTRAARAMGWEYSGGYRKVWMPSVGDFAENWCIKPWQPTVSEKDFREMICEMEILGEDTMKKYITSMHLLRHGVGLLTGLAPLPTRVLAACEALEASR